MLPSCGRRWPGLVPPPVLLVLVAGAAPAGAQEAGGTSCSPGTFARGSLPGRRRASSSRRGGRRRRRRRAEPVGERPRPWRLLAAASRLFVAGRVLDDVRVAAAPGGARRRGGRRVRRRRRGGAAQRRLAGGRLRLDSRAGAWTWRAGCGRELRADRGARAHRGDHRGRCLSSPRGTSRSCPAPASPGTSRYWSSQEARIAPERAGAPAGSMRRQPEFFDRAGRVLTVLSVITRVAGGGESLRRPAWSSSSCSRGSPCRPRSRWSAGRGRASASASPSSCSRPLAALSLALTVIAIPLALALVWLYVARAPAGLPHRRLLPGRSRRCAPSARRRWPSRGARIAALALAVLVARSRPLRAHRGAADPPRRARARRGRLDAAAHRGYLGLPEEEGALS